VRKGGNTAVAKTLVSMGDTSHRLFLYYTFLEVLQQRVCNDAGM
jgi:hypothetical protein